MRRRRWFRGGWVDDIRRLLLSMAVTAMLVLVILGFMLFGAGSLERWTNEQKRSDEGGKELSPVSPAGGLPPGGDGDRPISLPPDARG
jgi:hypothetical protein